MIEQMRERLARHTPVNGKEGHVPPYRAAVLVPLVCVQDAVSTIFIHRTEDMGPHSGQMGFPGGMCEDGDRCNLARTALRETGEELGIDIAGIEVAGRLSDLVTWTSEILVRPFVGLLPELPVFSPDPVEVQEVHMAGLGSLQDSVMVEGNPYGLAGRE